MIGHSGETILLAGSTGVLGGAIATRLLDSGRRLRLLARDAGRVRAFAERGAEVAIGDLTDRTSVERAMAGITHVVTTANAFMNASRTAVSAVDVDGNRALIDAARDVGVKQFVFTSAWLPADYIRIDYFAAKRGTEEYLRSGGVPYTILRPSAFMETWAFVIGEPILKTGATQIFGDGRNPINFVAVDDVAAIAVLALGNPKAINAIVDVFGPENLTQLEVAAVFERIKGAPAKKRHLPVPMMKILPPLLKRFNPVLARQIDAGALMATVPHKVDPGHSRDAWNVPMTRLEDWARARYR
jgi:uncharacterized protein YbjT (DUF2867 family)